MRIEANDTTVLVLAGHSHINCFGVPNSHDSTTELKQVPSFDNVYGICAPWPRETDFSSKVASLVQGKTLAYLYSGWNQLLFASPEMFDFVSAEFPDLPLDPNAVVVPEDLVLLHEAVRHFPFALRAGFEVLREYGVSNISILCPPPPKEDNSKLKSRLPWEGVLVERAVQLGLDPKTASFLPPTIRLKLWGLIARIYRQEAERIGATFIGVPPASQDKFGYLKEEYWGADVTHANERYGIMYCQHILDSLSFGEVATCWAPCGPTPLNRK